MERPRFRLRQAYGAIRRLPDEADFVGRENPGEPRGEGAGSQNPVSRRSQIKPCLKGVILLGD